MLGLPRLLPGAEHERLAGRHGSGGVLQTAGEAQKLEGKLERSPWGLTDDGGVPITVASLSSRGLQCACDASFWDNSEEAMVADKAGALR